MDKFRKLMLIAENPKFPLYIRAEALAKHARMMYCALKEKEKVE